MKPSSLFPPVPRWQRAKNSIWLQFVIVFAFLFACALVGMGIASAEPVEATQPDPRIEWVTVDVSGMTLRVDAKHISAPLPPGSWICVPCKMKHSPPSRRDA